MSVRMEGLEPSRLTALAPKASVYTNFTTSAHLKISIKCNTKPFIML